jgi:hypothetical protein
VIVNDPVCVVVPEIRPLELSSVSPLGSEPELSLHRYGTCPPAAEIEAEYSVPLVTGGRLVVVIVKLEAPGLTVTVADAFLVASVWLTAVTVTVLAVPSLGAANDPCGEIVPKSAVQLTAVSGVLVTLAVKSCCAPGCRTMLVGEISTRTAALEKACEFPGEAQPELATSSTNVRIPATTC